MNLLLFNLRMDVADPALGFTTGWTNALARHFDHVSVVTMGAGEAPVAGNVSVYSLGKECGYSEPRRALRFYKLVHRILSEREIDVCFSHMAPVFALLFAPLARARGIPVLLWYAHGAISVTLRLAHPLVDRCVTSTPFAFRLPSDKLFVIGQGVDTEFFHPPVEQDACYGTTAVAVGRLSPVKGTAEMLDALAIVKHELGGGLRLVLVGGALTETDQDYARHLREKVARLDIEAEVEFLGALPFGEVPARLRRASLYLNLTEDSLDKAILEAMASGCVPVTRNRSLHAILRQEGLDWLCAGPGPQGLAATIAAVQALDAADRDRLSRRLRGVVEQHHSLDRLAATLAAHLDDLVAKRRKGRGRAQPRSC